MWKPTGVKVKAHFLNGAVHMHQLCHNITVVILETSAAEYYSWSAFGFMLFHLASYSS